MLTFSECLDLINVLNAEGVVRSQWLFFSVDRYPQKYALIRVETGKEMTRFTMNFELGMAKERSMCVREKECLFVDAGVMKVHRVSNIVRKITKVSLVLGTDFFGSKHCFRETCIRLLSNCTLPIAQMLCTRVMNVHQLCKNIEKIKTSHNCFLCFL